MVQNLCIAGLDLFSPSIVISLDHFHACDILIQSSFEFTVFDFMAFLHFFKQASLFDSFVHANTRVLQQDYEAVYAQTMKDLDNQLSCWWWVQCSLGSCCGSLNITDKSRIIRADAESEAYSTSVLIFLAVESRYNFDNFTLNR